MSRYVFEVAIPSQEHPVSNKRVRNKVLAVLQDVIDHIIDPSDCFIDEQGYILQEDDSRLPYIRIYDKENTNFIPF